MLEPRSRQIPASTIFGTVVSGLMIRSSGSIKRWTQCGARRSAGDHIPESVPCVALRRVLGYGGRGFRVRTFPDLIPLRPPRSAGQ